MKNTTIKTFQLALCMALAIAATSCKKDKNEVNGTGKTGTFSIDGTAFSGNTSVQTFVNDNYSVLCEQDSPYELLQITFHDQAEAEAGGTFDVGNDVINTASGEVSITIGGLTYENDGAQSLSVSGNKITISNVKVKQTGGGSLRKTINSANINF